MITEPAAKKPLHSASSRDWLAMFKPPPPIPVSLTNPAEIAAEYRRWQLRVLVFATFGYAMFYFVRKNLRLCPCRAMIKRLWGSIQKNLGRF